MPRHTIKRRLRKGRVSKTRLRRERRPQRGGGDFKKMADEITRESMTGNKDEDEVKKYYLELAKDLLGKIRSSQPGVIEYENEWQLYNRSNLHESKIQEERGKLTNLLKGIYDEYYEIDRTIKERQEQKENTYDARTERSRVGNNMFILTNALVNLNSKDVILKELACNLNSTCETDKQKWPLDLKKGLFNGAKRRQWLEDKADLIFENEKQILINWAKEYNKREPALKLKIPAEAPL